MVMMTRSKTRKLMNKEDRLSALPNDLLLHIMSFMTIQQAVQTTILSTHWKNLWKLLPNIKLHSINFSNYILFYKFVSGIVSCRDGDNPLLSLDFVRHSCFDHDIMMDLMKYVVCHNIQRLKVYVPFNIGLPTFVYSCQSLTSLSISVSSYDFLKRTQIPKSLDLPALLRLYLDNVAISGDENGHAEPFSNCKKLNTLYMEDCRVLCPKAVLTDGSEMLSITNASLVNLTLDYTSRYKTVITAPNLSSFTYNGAPFQTLSEQDQVNVEILSSSLISNRSHTPFNSLQMVRKNVYGGFH